MDEKELGQLNTKIFIEATIHGEAFLPLTKEDLEPKSYRERMFSWGH